ncbi:MAG: hypothetical protein AAB551_03060 [Patescibacteria group bacterium]
MKLCRSSSEFSFFQPRRLVSMADGPSEDPGVQLSRFEANKSENQADKTKELRFTSTDLQNLRGRLEDVFKGRSNWDAIDKRLKTLELYRIDLDQATNIIKDGAQKQALGRTDFPQDVSVATTKARETGRAESAAAVDKWIQEEIDDFEGSDGEQRFANKTYQAVRGFLIGALVTDPVQYKAMQKEILRRFKNDRDDRYISEKTGTRFDWEDLKGLQLYKDNSDDVNAANDSWLYSANSGLKKLGISLLGHAHERYLATLLMSAEKFFYAQEKATVNGARSTQFYDAYKAYMMNYLAEKKPELNALGNVDTTTAYRDAEGGFSRFFTTVGTDTAIGAGSGAVVGGGAGSVVPVVGTGAGAGLGGAGGGILGAVGGVFHATGNAIWSKTGGASNIYKENFEAQEKIIHGIATPQEWYTSLVNAAKHTEEKAAAVVKDAPVVGAEKANDVMKDPNFKSYYENVLLPYGNFVTLGSSFLFASQEMGLQYPTFPQTIAFINKVLTFGDHNSHEFLKKFNDPTTGVKVSEISDAAYGTRSSAEKFFTAYQAGLRKRFEAVTSRLNPQLNGQYAAELGRINTALSADFSKNYLDVSKTVDLANMSTAFFDLKNIEKAVGIVPAGTPAAGPTQPGTPAPSAPSAKPGTPAPANPAVAPTAPGGTAPGKAPAGDKKPDGKTGDGKTGKPPEKPSDKPEKLTDEQKAEIRKNAKDYFEIDDSGKLSFKASGKYTAEQAAKALRMQDIMDPKESPYVFMASPAKRVFTVAHYEGEGEEAKYTRRFSDPVDGNGKIISAYIYANYRCFKDKADFLAKGSDLFNDMPKEKDKAAQYVKEKYSQIVGADGKIGDEMSKAVFAAMLKHFSDEVLKKETVPRIFYPLVLSDMITINYAQDGFAQSDIDKVCNAESPVALTSSTEILDTDTFEAALRKLPNGVMDNAAEAKIKSILKGEFDEVVSFFREHLKGHAETPLTGEKAKETYADLMARTGKFEENVVKFLEAPDLNGHRAQSFTPLGGSKIQFDRSLTTLDYWASVLDMTKGADDSKNYTELFESLRTAKQDAEK